jgi:putative restriction endonuclease
MTIPLMPAIATLLEKVAVDNGFDRELPREGNWLAYASTQAPLRLWLSTFSDALFIAGFSQANVARALAEHGSAVLSPLPAGAVAGRSVVDIPALHYLIRRAFQLSRTLPDELLQSFAAKTETMPRATEAERLVIQRVGQNIFRDGLLDYWDGRCAVTGLAVPELLRASHIKPWAKCNTDAERLDVFNGLLLAPHLDAAFDGGFITVADDGAVIVSPCLGPLDRNHLGLALPLRVARMSEGHRAYLKWHQREEFKAQESKMNQ